MHIANVTNYARDFATIQAFQKKRKTFFIGNSRTFCVRGQDFFAGYITHRMIVREHVEDNDIIGYAECVHFPKIEALSKDSWIYWMNHFCLSDEMTSGNVIFLNFLIYSPAHNPQLFLNIVKEIFFRENEKHYILVIEFPQQNLEDGILFNDYPNYEFLKDFATVVYPKVFSLSNCRNTQRIHVIKRDDVVERMCCRKAIPGDNDEIVEIIDQEHPDFREKHGDFYVTEELLRQMEDKHEHNCFIIIEVSLKPIGFIWINKNLDIEKLVNNFELEMFGNLVKFSPDEPHVEKIIRTTGVRQKLKSHIFTEDAIQNILPSESASSVQSENSRDDNVPMSYRSSMLSDATISQSTHRYSLREKLLKTMQEIEETFGKPDYYTQQYDKTFFFRYNISQDNNCNEEIVDEEEVDEEKGEEEEMMKTPTEPISNAFCVQFFGIHSSYDIRRIHSILATSFSAFCDRDYCLISVPKSAKQTKSLNEILKYFVSVVPRPHCKIDDYLYVTHRSSVFSDLTVANLRSEDATDIENILMQGKQQKRRITRYPIGNEFNQEFTSELEMVRGIMAEVLKNPITDYNFLTIRVGDSSKPIDKNIIVGYVILRKLYHLHLLEHHFRIPKSSPFMATLRGEVIFFKLHPFYHAHSDTIFREISRYVDIYDYYYFAPNMFSHKSITNDLIGKMQPIEPHYYKKKYKYVKSSDADLNIAEHLLELNYASDTFSVFNINMRPTRYFGNQNSIIIIGFSNESKAFLRSIVFNFNNIVNKNSHCCVPLVKITVIVRPGEEEAEYDKELRCTMCENQNDCWINYSNWNEYIRDTVERIDLRVYVKFINAKIDHIDRRRNFIILKDKCEFYYDILLICTSTHFGIPMEDFQVVLPYNYAQINNRLDKIAMFHKVKYIRQQKTPIKIVVYGSHISTFEYINFLLKHGIDAKSIKLVIPFELSERELHLYYNISYADLNIELILQQMIEDLGVKCYDQMNFKEWKCYSCNNNNISHVIFESFPKGKTLTLECDLLVWYYENHIDAEIIHLIQAADIKMNKRCILIDENYRTNDPRIYALGKFVERLEKPNYQYNFVSPIESSKQLIHKLGLNLVPEEINERFRMPTYFQAQLPMGYYFVKITIPKLYLANHLPNDYGRLVTYQDYTFFRVRLNNNGIVEEFACVTQQRMSFDFLQYFVGKHEALLNNLKTRWYLGEIGNFLDFFQEPWCELILHRKFNQLRATIKKLSLETAQDIMKTHSDKDRISRKNLMKSLMNNMGTTEEVENAVLNFLRTFRSDFPKNLFALSEDFLAARR